MTATEALPSAGPEPEETPTVVTTADTPPVTGSTSPPRELPSPVEPSDGPTPVGAETEPLEATEPIACKTDRDCWLDDAQQPVARPKNKRNVKLTPCQDGDRVPACEQRVCVARQHEC